MGPGRQNGALGVPWAPLGGPWGTKMLPNGALGGPLGTLERALGPPGNSRGQLFRFLIDFGSFFDTFWELKWRPKLINMVSKNEVKNNTEIKQDFHEKLTELRCQNVRYHGKYRCLLKVTLFTKKLTKILKFVAFGCHFCTLFGTKSYPKA